MKIFVASVGRSGTLTIAKTFQLKHEPYEWAYKDKFNIDLLKKRANNQEQDKGFYGEVGHHIIRNIPKIKKEFPNAVYIHSVRNARDVVKSFWQLEFSEDKVFGKDFDGNRLEKICQMWTYWNKKADGLINNRIRFEDFCEYIPKRNSKKKQKQHKKWTDKQEKILQKYCGKLMKKYGYK